MVAVQTGTETAGQRETLGAALTAFRNRAITWGEADRAARPAGTKGTDAPLAEWSIESELGRSLSAFAEQPDAIGQSLPLNLLRRLTEALAPDADTANKSYGTVAGQGSRARAGNSARQEGRGDLGRA